MPDLTAREASALDELDETLARAELAEQERDHLRTQLDALRTAIADTDTAATNLAEARQTLAHKGTGYIPPWHGLTDHERKTATLDARNWLKSLRNILEATPPAGLGSSRRAQDAPAIVYAGDPRRRAVAFNALSRALSAVDRFVSLSEREMVTAAVLNALDADRPQSGHFPPSQGQEIPDDQLNAVLEDAHATGQDSADWARQVARIAYRIGFAGALGYEITIDDGGRVGVGDRPEPTNTVETAEDAARRFAGELERLRTGLLALDRDPKDNPVTSALDAIVWRNVDLERVTAERDQLAEHLDRIDARTRLAVTLTVVDHPQWSGHITILGFAAPQTAMRIGRVFTDALTRYVGARVQATLIDPRDAAADPLRPGDVAP